MPRRSRQSHKWDEGAAPVAAAAPAAAEEVEARSRRSSSGNARTRCCPASRSTPAAATTHETAETPEGDMLGADWESSSSGTERDLSYLTRRRRQGSIVAPEEYDFQVHQHDRERPHELLARLNRYRGDRPRCDKKAGFHLIDPEQVHAGNLAFLSEYVTEGGMIAKRHQSRLCARCQRSVRKSGEARGRWA